MKITISSDNLPFSFFEAIDLDFYEIIIKIIQNKKSLSYSSSVEIFEKHNKAILDELYKMRDNQVISDCWEEDQEVEEYNGTFAYSVYEIKNVNEIKKKLRKEIKSLINMFF